MSAYSSLIHIRPEHTAHTHTHTHVCVGHSPQVLGGRPGIALFPIHSGRNDSNSPNSVFDRKMSGVCGDCGGAPIVVLDSACKEREGREHTASACRGKGVTVYKVDSMHFALTRGRSRQYTDDSSE